jgi:hypothetical protein
MIYPLLPDPCRVGEQIRFPYTEPISIGSPQIGKREVEIFWYVYECVRNVQGNLIWRRIC